VKIRKVRDDVARSEAMIRQAWETLSEQPDNRTTDVLREMADAVVILAGSIDMLEQLVEEVEKGEPCPPDTSGTSSNG
jgi:hypothetical protein